MAAAENTQGEKNMEIKSFATHTIAEVMESPAYKVHSAECAVWDALEVLKKPDLTRDEALDVIDAFGAMVGEIYAHINGYFDDHEENYQFCDFIR